MRIKTGDIVAVLRAHGSVYADQAMYSATNAVTLILAARTLSGRELSNLSIQMFMALGFVLLQRASITGPAMVTQRTLGPSRIPLCWLAASAAALSCACFGISWMLHGMIGIADLKSAALLSGVTLLLSSQDGLRYWAISSGSSTSALAGDSVWCLVIIIWYLLKANGPLHSSTFLEITATCAGTSALAILCLGHGRGQGGGASFRTTWRLGRWGTITSLSSTVGVLVPLVAASRVLDPTVSGLYRTLQTVLGPLGVMATSISTSLLSKSWRYLGADGVKRLQRLVRLYSGALLTFSAIYLGVGVLVVIVLSNIRLGHLWYVPIVVVVGGVLGSPVTPLSSGSLILGQQRAASVIALTIFASTLLVTIVASVGPLAGRFDPVAAATLGAGALGVPWWIVVFRHAVQRELLDLAKRPLPIPAAQPMP